MKHIAVRQVVFAVSVLAASAASAMAPTSRNVQGHEAVGAQTSPSTGATIPMAQKRPPLNNEVVCSQPGYSQDQRCVGG